MSNEYIIVMTLMLSESLKFIWFSSFFHRNFELKNWIHKSKKEPSVLIFTDGTYGLLLICNWNVLDLSFETWFERFPAFIIQQLCNCLSDLDLKSSVSSVVIILSERKGQKETFCLEIQDREVQRSFTYSRLLIFGLLKTLCELLSKNINALRPN